MRRAVKALEELNEGSPCAFAAFGCVIVNHSAVAVGGGGEGEEVCIGANAIMREGNPTLHGMYCPGVPPQLLFRALATPRLLSGGAG